MHLFFFLIPKIIVNVNVSMHGIYHIYIYMLGCSGLDGLKKKTNAILLYQILYE